MGRRCGRWPLLAAAAAAEQAGGDGPAALPVAVVEEHGDVVRFWLEGLGHLPQSLWEEPYLPSFAATSLLHVDSHSDMMLARWDDVQEKMRGHETDMQRLGTELIRAPAIGDFISGAIFAQLVSDVVWLRSDFVSGKYNGPAPGVYEVGIGTDGSNLSSVGEEDEVLCFRTFATRFRPEDDTFANHDHEKLDDCGPEGPQHARTANLSVATLDQLLSGPAGFARPLLAHQNWILDVDLDFFASKDPTVDYFNSRGFSDDLVLQHVQNSLRCPNETQIGDVLSLFRHFVRGSSAEGAKGRLMQRRGPCRVFADRLQGLYDTLSDMDDGRVLAWRDLWRLQDIEDWVGTHDFMTTLFLEGPHAGPHHVASEMEVEAQLDRFEALLAQVVRENGQPRLVTIARSMKYDHYLPPELRVVIDFP